MTAAAPDIEVEIPVGEVDLAATLRAAAILPRDPTVVLRPTAFARATITPDGPGTLSISWGSSTDTAGVSAWGPGAPWLVERIGRLLGLEDDPSGFSPDHEILHDLARRNPGLRLTRTGTVWHDLVALVLQQRIRFTDAAAQWRDLVDLMGDVAPGPFDLRLPPDPERVAGASYHDFHRVGIERSRAETLIRSARELPRFEHAVDRPYADVEPRLTSIRGLGPWTRGGLAGVTWGDPDAVVLGDVGIPSMVSYTLAGEERADDERMLELLEPHRPHRYRALQLIFLAGSMAPRRGPRLAGHRIHDR